MCQVENKLKGIRSICSDCARGLGGEPGFSVTTMLCGKICPLCKEEKPLTSVSKWHWPKKKVEK